ncbi:hypothetical protein [Parabacteroides merdae]|uniref:Uncharacterized protein n=1 Tax=Parabacteroides merdae TaxID=46503 RepID=A0AA44APB0_9BACT|nr:hypothetical protein [Parabacteroides merdae]MTT24032.1 hypothetical protein [Parabacteroides merdae]MTU64270.1 hypothetical protein [Parabacteroides merdae]MTU70819.1 hypothetical protein [Parabacteroides merdae]MTU71732.1 hypothetical protein [Parabacteroides merdae]MTU90657.1 hypothetical protein [Parabacteroides merdae]
MYLFIIILHAALKARHNVVSDFQKRKRDPQQTGIYRLIAVAVPQHHRAGRRTYKAVVQMALDHFEIINVVNNIE